MSVFNSTVTLEQLKYLSKTGLEQSRPFWNFGQYARLTEVFPTLRSGIWFIIAPENVGKSMYQINLGYQILANNPESYWLDFSLDDSIENRYSYLLARAGDLSINLMQRAGDASEELQKRRAQTFDQFARNYRHRYRVLGLTSNPEHTRDTVRFSAEWVCRTIQEARQQIGPEGKLFVTVDGFHDLELEQRSEDEHTKQRVKSEMIKFCALDHDALVVMSAHCRKDSRRRGMTTDVLKGDDAPLYHAIVISHLFSDVNLNRDNAVVYWEDDKHPDTRMPVHELDILKNKAGSYKGVLFYNYDPRRCLDFEVPDEIQQYYRSCVYAK